MTLLELQGYTKKWQRILRLEDWDLDVKFVPRWELEESVGNAAYNDRLGKAWIRIQEPEHGDEDTELTLVHELLHVKSQGFHNEDVGQLKGAKLVALERMIEQTAQALVKLDREVVLAVLEAKKEALDEVLGMLREV